MKENLSVIFGVAVIAVLFVLVTVLQLGTDRQPPEIIFEGEMSYSDTQDIDVLLYNVTAYDNRDGDVSRNLKIESLIVLEGNEHAKVTYTVKDNHNNIAKKSRLVAYKGQGRNIYTSLAAQEITTSAQSLAEGTPEQTSAGQTQRAPEQTTAGQTQRAASASAPVIKLKTSSATVKIGGNFNITTYIENITDDKDTRSELFRRIIISGGYDTNTAGEYRLTVYCTDSDRNISNREAFILNVTED